jgi:catechol 2,3-dioxygenase-like lactoylglutathione lyase family enzyme
MAQVRLQHVSVIIHEGGQEAARAFYGGLLGLREKEPPRSLAHLHLVWFNVGEGEMELHCTPNGPSPRGDEQQHVCLAVDDLATYRSRLSEAGVLISEAEPIPYRPRFFCRDPFGNLIELTSIEGDYRQAQEQ